MSSTAVPTAPSKQSLILEIIQLALTGLQAVPIASAGAALVSTFLAIYQNAAAAYEAETGTPFNVTKIPLETPVQ